MYYVCLLSITFVSKIKHLTVGNKCCSVYTVIPLSMTIFHINCELLFCLAHL